MTEVTVRSIMRKDFPTLGPEMPIRRAVAFLVKGRAAAAPVIADDGRLAGILTQKDCFRPALHASYYQEWKGSVADYMTKDVVAIDVETELISAAELFLEYPHRAFPAKRGEAVEGILHRSDVLARLMELG